MVFVDGDTRQERWRKGRLEKSAEDRMTSKMKQSVEPEGARIVPGKRQRGKGRSRRGGTIRNNKWPG